jgi:hypothetical protein
VTAVRYARDAQGLDTGASDATPIDTTVTKPSSNQFLTVARIVGAVLDALSAGARSAAHGDTSGLTYADGWTSAATLARLVSADTMAEIISPREV